MEKELTSVLIVLLILFIIYMLIQKSDVCSIVRNEKEEFNVGAKLKNWQKAVGVLATGAVLTGGAVVNRKDNKILKARKKAAIQDAVAEAMAEEEAEEIAEEAEASLLAVRRQRRDDANAADAYRSWRPSVVSREAELQKQREKEHSQAVAASPRLSKAELAVLNRPGLGRELRSARPQLRNAVPLPVTIREKERDRRTRQGQREVQEELSRPGRPGSLRRTGEPIPTR